MNGAYCEAYRARSVRASFNCFVNCNFEVADVVERVKNTDNVNAVFNALCNKHSYNVVRVVLVAEKILASEKHLKLCIGAGLADFAKSLPRILRKVSEA